MYAGDFETSFGPRAWMVDVPHDLGGTAGVAAGIGFIRICAGIVGAAGHGFGDGVRADRDVYGAAPDRAVAAGRRTGRSVGPALHDAGERIHGGGGYVVDGSHAGDGPAGGVAHLPGDVADLGLLGVSVARLQRVDHDAGVEGTTGTRQRNGADRARRRTDARAGHRGRDDGEPGGHPRHFDHRLLHLCVRHRYAAVGANTESSGLRSRMRGRRSRATSLLGGATCWTGRD